jgi:hypothetical protein
MKTARVASYREGAVQCIRGPIAEARAMRDLIMEGNAAAVLRIENFNYGTDDAYIEIALPFVPGGAS